MNNIKNLIEKIIDIGVPLPTYNYELKKFETTTPTNLNLAGAVRGIEQPTWHDSFEDACQYIIKLHE